MEINRRGAPLGIVGVGDLGSGIARSLLAAGFQVLVYDVRPERMQPLIEAGATAAETIEAMGQTAETILVVVLDDDQVRDVVRRILAGPVRPSVLAVQSTVLPSTVVELAREAEPLGVRVIDAAVTGGSGRAARGEATVLIGGDEEIVEKTRPIFETMGRHLFRIGPVGSGCAAKLINNALGVVYQGALLEVMQLASAYGIDEDTVTSFVAVGSADSRAVRTWGLFDRLRRTHTLAGTSGVYTLLTKDLEGAVKAGTERGVDLPLLSSAAGLMEAKYRDRDMALARRQPMNIPRCQACGHELALPFRVRGLHPECATQDP